jgi:hypothetical protein
MDAPRVYATNVTADGDKTRVRVTVTAEEIAFLILEIDLKTSNADIAVAQTQERLVDLFESMTKELREQGLHLESKVMCLPVGPVVAS